MPSLLIPNSPINEVISPLQSLPFLLPELASSEVEEVLRNNPEVAYKFVEKCAKGELDWNQFTPMERGLILQSTVEAKLNQIGRAHV